MFFKEQINPKNLRITLETLINIRWIAVIGQFFTVSFVYYGLKFQFPYFETLVLISNKYTLFLLFVLPDFISFKSILLNSKNSELSKFNKKEFKVPKYF